MFWSKLVYITLLIYLSSSLLAGIEEARWSFTVEHHSEEMRASNIELLDIDNIPFIKDFTIPEYETLSKLDVTNVDEVEGTFAGTYVKWITVEQDGILYFYTKYLDEDEANEPQAVNYAIISDKYSLQNGLYVGMTEEEVIKLLPDCKICETSDLEGGMPSGALPWNIISFPEGWCESYDKIIVAQINYEEVLPWYLGLMIDDEGIVRAITTCYPTAG